MHDDFGSSVLGCALIPSPSPSGRREPEITQPLKEASQALLAALRSVRYRRLLGDLPGYNAAETGTIIG